MDTPASESVQEANNAAIVEMLRKFEADPTIDTLVYQISEKTRFVIDIHNMYIEDYGFYGRQPSSVKLGWYKDRDANVYYGPRFNLVETYTREFLRDLATYNTNVSKLVGITQVDVIDSIMYVWLPACTYGTLPPTLKTHMHNMMRISRLTTLCVTFNRLEVFVYRLRDGTYKATLGSNMCEVRKDTYHDIYYKSKQLDKVISLFKKTIKELIDMRT